MPNFILNKKNVHKLNSYFNSRRGSRQIPYALGSRLIAWFCKTDFAREKFFKNKVPLFREFLKSLPAEYDADKLIPYVLYSNYLKGWRSSSLSWMSQRKLRRHVQFNGLELLEKYQREKKGVIILNSHFGLAQAGLTVFPKLGYNEFYTIVRAKGLESMKFEGLKENAKPKLLAFKDNSQSELFRQMYRAREVLNEGGIVHLLGDGYHGMSSNTIPFLGKLRGFRSSYAELSLSSGAEILPVFIDCPINKKIIVDILPPLDQGDDSMKPEERREHITLQYAKLLEERWLAQPWNVNWRFIEKHLYQVDAPE